MQWMWYQEGAVVERQVSVAKEECMHRLEAGE